MCGFSGFIDFRKKLNLNMVKKMTNALTHRGPDDAGYFFSQGSKFNIGMGHRRLSILDLSKKGVQPMSFNELKIVYNGEVYNFREIRIELEKFGYIFQSNSDTEVILKAYDNWGLDFVSRLNGMFSIAIYNESSGMLTLIRDRAGVKPMYWHKSENLFMFASELKAFYENPFFKKDIDFESLSSYLSFGYISQPHSIFKDTFKLESGCYLTFNTKTQDVFIKRYWNISDSYISKNNTINSEQEALQSLDDLINSSCSYRSISDVPVGVFLSGGYDSSLVAAVMQSNSVEKIKTFTIGFSDKKYNEAIHAKNVSNYLQTDHHELYCTSKDVASIIQKLPKIWDEPFADDSCLPTVLLSQFARDSVKVALSADGGDELFGGYKKYQTVVDYYSILKHVPFRRPLSKALRRTANNIHVDQLLENFSGKVDSFASIMGAKTIEDSLLDYQRIFSTSDISQLTLSDLDGRHPEFPYSDSIFNKYEKLMDIDFKTYLSDDILTKLDRSTMFSSLEGREPLLDHRLIEFAAQLDTSLKITKGSGKYLLKKLAHKYIPSNLLDRPKMGFSPPLYEWFSDILDKNARQYFDPCFIKKQKIFNYREVNSLLLRVSKGDNSAIRKLWVLLVFQLWYVEWMT
jgi:asparagine synthase (glutamine-hydrolysing)